MKPTIHPRAQRHSGKSDKDYSEKKPEQMSAPLIDFFNPEKMQEKNIEKDRLIKAKEIEAAAKLREQELMIKKAEATIIEAQKFLDKMKTKNS